MATVLEQINTLSVNVKNIDNQLNYMKKIVTIASDNTEIIAETETEIKKLRRFIEPNVFGVSLFPAGIEYVYVWELTDGKYYVGYSANLSNRLEQHMSDSGANWTKKYKPISIIEVLRGDKDTEKQKTLEYMKKKGFENVRGAGWCLSEYKNTPPEVIKYCNE